VSRRYKLNSKLFLLVRCLVAINQILIYSCYTHTVFVSLVSRRYKLNAKLFLLGWCLVAIN